MSPIAELILAWYGEAEHLVGEPTGGWTDTPLTERGIKQINLLAKRLVIERNHKEIHLGASNLQRAIHSAEIIADAMKISLHIYPAFVDINNGITAGLTKKQAKEHFMPLPELYLDWQPYPGAETGVNSITA